MENLPRRYRRYAERMARRRGVSHQNLPKSKRKFKSDGVAVRLTRSLGGQALWAGLMARAI